MLFQRHYIYKLTTFPLAKFDFKYFVLLYDCICFLTNMLARIYHII